MDDDCKDCDFDNCSRLDLECIICGHFRGEHAVKHPHQFLYFCHPHMVSSITGSGVPCTSEQEECSAFMVSALDIDQALRDLDKIDEMLKVEDEGEGKRRLPWQGRTVCRRDGGSDEPSS